MVPGGVAVAGGPLILDAAAILQGGTFLAGQALMTVPAVAAELAGEPYFEGLCAAGLAVVAPTPESRAEVMRAAKRLGEERTLSAADLEVLSLAFERDAEGAVLLTDDYALQNVATALGVAFAPIRERGISEVRTYGRRCRSCRRWATVAETKEVCAVCGGPLGRARQGPV